VLHKLIEVNWILLLITVRDGIGDVGKLFYCKVFNVCQERFNQLFLIAFFLTDCTLQLLGEEDLGVKGQLVWRHFSRIFGEFRDFPKNVICQ